MKVSDFKEHLIKFQQKLEEHSSLYSNSLERGIPDLPVRNIEELKSQTRWLSRKLGYLRPYLYRFKSNWLMYTPATGVQWDALKSAVAINDTAAIKGSSIDSVISELDIIIGQLESLDPEDDIPEDSSKPIKPGMEYDKVVLAYLDRLHPYINESCSELFLDSHYTQAIEEAVKAVFEYIRKKTKLKIDGEDLINQVFSTSKPLLSFGDLNDQNILNEQIGFMKMLKGFYKGVRNPLAHTQGKKEIMIKAFEYLVMASLFCRRIDETKEVGQELLTNYS